MIWDNHYSNTLRDSKLRIREWDGRPNFGSQQYHSSIHPPSQLAERVFEFDLVNDSDPGWRDTTNDQFHTSKWIAEYAVRRLLELVRADKGARDNWA